MGFMKREDVRGYYFNTDYVCVDCVTDKELSELREEEILTEMNMSEEAHYFCDRCRKQLWKNLKERKGEKRENERYRNFEN